MAKRKAGVNNIIYELDNDDSEISSEDEVRPTAKQPKIHRFEANNSPNTTQSEFNTHNSCIEVIDIDSSVEKVDEIRSPISVRNGGKTSDEFIIIDEYEASPKPAEEEIDSGKKTNADTIFNEDIIIDSPATNSDPGVVGCENRTPLITVRFRDSKLAMNYKEKIKAFMLNLIKLHDQNADTDNETDLELDIWPEDLTEENIVVPEKPADNLFFIDTDPCIHVPDEIPRYSQNSSMISNIEKELTPPPVFRKGPICFNCDGSHALRECQRPRNMARIAEKRKAMTKMGRYHVEDEQKYGHLVPGRISGHLRHALGLKRHELPLYIYQMRHLGYPPGWLEEARISHSGITLFDSTGQAALEPEEEEGEVCEPGSKDKFDIKKILDFPGFNVPASSRYKDESTKLGLLPMSEQDSKMAMLQMLAPNAMKAYKRKKLTLFPSATGSAPLAGQAEMDIDSGDEVADFPSQPPLPDDAPPPPPPPPDAPPPPDSPPPGVSPEKPTETQDSSKKSEQEASQNKSLETEQDSKKSKNMIKSQTESDDDLEVIEVIKVGDIPVPIVDLITIDVDGEVSEPESGRTSPTLDDLELKKQLLLNALKSEINTTEKVIASNEDSKDIDTLKQTEVHTDATNTEVTNTEVSNTEASNTEASNTETTNTQTSSTEVSKDSTAEVPSEMQVDDKESGSSTKPDVAPTAIGTPKSDKEMKGADSDSDVTKTPTSTTGQVRDTLYGTPVFNIASPYIKLPSDDKFAKDICDVINFENLPNSTGKYKQISTLLKKVKSEVDRIQES